MAPIDETKGDCSSIGALGAVDPSIYLLTQRDQIGVAMANPMLTVGTLRVPRKGVLPWLVCWARHASTIELCPDLAPRVTSQPSKKYYFHYRTLFTLLVPGQAVVLGRLSLCVQFSPEGSIL